MKIVKINEINDIDNLHKLIFQDNREDFEKEIDNIILKEEENFDKEEILEKTLEVLDLTSLNNVDNKQSLEDLVKQGTFIVKNKEKHVAGLCTFSNLLPLLNSIKINKNIKKVVVSGGFPTGQLSLEAKIKDIEFAISNNADEIDIPINRGLFFEDKKELERELKVIKNIVNQKDNVKLKVILETGELKNLKNVYDASILAMNCGADFIKTSTGKINVGADKYSSAVMLIAIRDFLKENNYTKLVGFKAAGGVRTITQVLEFISLFYFFISKEYFNKSLFRLGCSNLKNEIISNLKQI
jgi:deoxyribose-phosphate aldolase